MGEGDSGVGVAAPAGESPPPGYGALAEGCALAAPPPASWLELTGEDRARFLHGQITCDVNALAAGGGVYGFLLSPKGRVLADAVISAEAESLRVELPPGAAEEAADRLLRYVVADRVEIASPEPRHGLLVAGGEAAESLRRLLGGADPPVGWNHAEGSVDGHPLTVRGERRLGVPAWRLLGSDRAIENAAESLRGAGAVTASEEALEAIRVERGLPRAGVDFDDRHFPQETGLEKWGVSYTKGCYVGQEVVARIHYRGRANHQLRGLRAVAESTAPATGPLVDAEGEDSGRLTSSVWSPAAGRAIGLAVLHRHQAEPGTRLFAVGGAELEVVALPFVKPASGQDPDL